MTEQSKPRRRRKATPKRGIRKRVLGEGEGDYCVYEVVTGGDLPKGSLLPIPEVPRFTDTQAALKWIRNGSGDLLTGKQIMVFQAKELLTIRVQTKPTVVIESKPKVVVTDPSQEQGEG